MKYLLLIFLLIGCEKQKDPNNWHDYNTPEEYMEKRATHHVQDAWTTCVQNKDSPSSDLWNCKVVIYGVEYHLDCGERFCIENNSPDWKYEFGNVKGNK